MRRPTWFPCNDLARQKAPFRTTVTVASSYYAVANGRLLSKRPCGNRTTWVYEQVEPTSPYLATLHVGRYERQVLAKGPVPVVAVVPPEHRRAFAQAFSRQLEMLDVFVDWFGPYPFEAGYTVVLSGDELDLPLEAQGQSIFGTNHLDGASGRADRPRARAPVVRQQPHGCVMAGHLVARGVRLLRRVAVVGGLRRPWRRRTRRCTARLQSLPQDLVLADPGPKDLFDDRVYKRGARHAPRCAASSARRRSASCCTAGRRTTSTAP